jgi:uncharacterized tellurite resistance protein B-like protein
MTLNTWSKAYFYSYILLSVAKSDGVLEPSEMEKIDDFLSKFELDEDQFIPTIKLAWDSISSITEEERLDFIKENYQKYFTSKAEIQELMVALEELILADFNIEKTEIKLYAKIRKLMEVED